MSIYEIIMSDDVVKTINDNLELVLSIIPELKCIIDFPHKHPHHNLDVWNHTITALSFSKKDFEIRLSLLLHDIGKPFSYTEKDGVRHYEGHNELSYKISYTVLNRLGYDKEFNNNILYLVLNHDIPIKSSEIKKNYSLELKRFEIQRCDILAHDPECLEKRIEYLNTTKNKLLKYKK